MGVQGGGAAASSNGASSSEMSRLISSGKQVDCQLDCGYSTMAKEEPPKESKNALLRWWFQCPEKNPVKLADGGRLVTKAHTWDMPDPPLGSRLRLTLFGHILGALIVIIGFCCCAFVESQLPARLALRPKLAVYDAISGSPVLSALAITVLPVITAPELYYAGGLPHKVPPLSWDDHDDSVDYQDNRQDLDEKTNWSIPKVWLFRFCIETTFSFAIIFITYSLGCHLAVWLLKWLVVGKQRPGRYAIWYSPRGYTTILWRLALTSSMGLWNFFDSWMPSSFWNPYLRAMGAHIGERVIIADGAPLSMINGADLISIGDDVAIEANARVFSVTADTPSVVTLGKIELSNRVFVAHCAEAKAGAKVGNDAVLCAGAGADAPVPAGTFVTSTGPKTFRAPGGFDTLVRLPPSSSPQAQDGVTPTADENNTPEKSSTKQKVHKIIKKVQDRAFRMACEWFPAATLVIGLILVVATVTFPIVLSLILALGPDAATRLRMYTLCARDTACRESARASERHIFHTYGDMGRQWQPTVVDGSVSDFVEAWQRSQYRLLGATVFSSGTVAIVLCFCMLTVCAWIMVSLPMGCVFLARAMKTLCFYSEGGSFRRESKHKLTPWFVARYDCSTKWITLATGYMSGLFLYSGLMNWVYSTFGLRIKAEATISEITCGMACLETIEIGQGAYLAANVAPLCTHVDLSSGYVTFAGAKIGDFAFIGPLSILSPGVIIDDYAATGSCAVVDTQVRRGHIAVGDDRPPLSLGWKPKPMNAWRHYDKVWAIYSTCALGGFAFWHRILSYAPAITFLGLFGPRLAARWFWGVSWSSLVLNDGGQGYVDDPSSAFKKGAFYGPSTSDTIAERLMQMYVNPAAGPMLRLWAALLFIVLHGAFFGTLLIVIEFFNAPSRALLQIATKWLLLGAVSGDDDVEYPLRSRKHMAWMLVLRAGRVPYLPSSLVFCYEFVNATLRLMGAHLSPGVKIFPQTETCAAFPEADVVHFGENTLFSAHVYGHDFSQMHLKFKNTFVGPQVRAPNAWQCQVLPGTKLLRGTSFATVGRASFFPGIVDQPYSTYRGNPARRVNTIEVDV